jgi:hypothetical protein
MEQEKISHTCWGMPSFFAAAHSKHSKGATPRPIPGGDAYKQEQAVAQKPKSLPIFLQWCPFSTVNR